MTDRVYCSFCGIGNHEVEIMLAGPVLVFICDVCVETAAEQTAQKRRDDAMVAEVVRCAGCIPMPLKLERSHG